MRSKVILWAGIILALFSSFAAYAAGPKAYIGLFKDNAVAVVDTAENRLLTTIPIPNGPHGLVITPDGRAVFASSDGDSKVSVIDTDTDSVRATIEVGKSPHGLAITPDGRTVLAAVFGANGVVFIDTATGRVLGKAVVASPHNIAVTPDGRAAYVAAQGKGAFALVILDVRGMRETGRVPLEKMPRALNISPDGTKLYFTMAGVDAVQVLDTVTNKITRQVAVGASPHHPLFEADGAHALVVSQGPGVLSVIDAGSATVTATVKVGTLPHWIALGPGGTTAWVTNEGSNDLSVVDLASLTVTATIPVGNAPRKIVVQPAAGATAAGGATAAAAVPAMIRTRISGFAFADVLRLRVGQTVTWTNGDSVPHTVTGDDGHWDSGDIPGGGSWSTRFDAPGTFVYHCGIHPAMQGTVIVSAGQ
jgi:YVTN family beta-propeller protein